MFDRRLPLSLALLAALTARQVAAHGYCIKFGVGDVCLSYLNCLSLFLTYQWYRIL